MSYTADAIELKIRNEQQRLARERQLYDDSWKALLKAWGQYHRHAWKTKQGYGKNILNLKNDTPYTNEDLERQLNRISEAYGKVKNSDRFMATLIVRFFVRETNRELMCDWYHWDKNRFYYWRKEASTFLRGIYTAN